ncbi:MAG: hypothetical protein FWF12_07765 [Betaproteobacteria bacterium]|nr:hypothetical protein [Betaproteobacteria bacterium]
MTSASTTSTMVFPGTNDPLIEPFIPSSSTVDTVQNEPEPTLAAETLSSPLPEMGDRIVVEPPYPGSSPVPTQFVRESTPPAMFGIAATILVVFLGGLWWWNSGKTTHFPEGANTPLPTQSSEPLRGTSPSPANTSASFPETASEQKLDLMGIPSLPENQRQGRHNSPEIKNDHSLPPYPSSLPPPADMPAPVETVNTHVPESMTAAPPWLMQMRKDLSNCRNFYCYEKVREQYCTGQQETPLECAD